MDYFNNIPTSLLLVLLIKAFWIAISFAFVQHILLKAIRNERMHDFVKFYNPLLRNVVWILFSIHVLYQLTQVSPAVSLAVVGVLLALGWQSVRDLVQGTIFRFQKGDISGQRLHVKKYTGIVNKMHNTKIELNTKDGEIVQIPYSHIISAVTTKPTATKHLKTGVVFLDLPEGSQVEEAKNKLKEQLLNLPWIVSSKGVKIEKRVQENGTIQLKIAFSTLSVAYVERVRELLHGS